MDDDGLDNYGRCLENGIGIDRNPFGAMTYYKLSADRANASGQWHYGLCLENGIGIEPDHSEATRYFKLSADQGHADAIRHVRRGDSSEGS
jgi:TPR repeat protein